MISTLIRFYFLLSSKSSSKEIPKTSAIALQLCISGDDRLLSHFDIVCLVYVVIYLVLIAIILSFSDIFEYVLQVS